MGGESRASRASRRHRRHVVPLAAIQLATAGFGGVATPLLEKERNVHDSTLIAKLSNPLWRHRLKANARLTAGDHPLQLCTWFPWRFCPAVAGVVIPEPTIEIQRSNEWLTAQEPHR